MERIKELKRKQFSPLVLWVDDIQRIEAVLSGFEGFCWICGNYKYERFAELVEHVGGEAIVQVEAECSNPYVSLDLDKGGASLYVYSNNENASLAFYEIAEILGKGQRFPKFIYNFIFLISISIFVQAAFWLTENAWSLAALLAFFCWFLYAGIVDMRVHSKIFFNKRNEQKSFFVRNMDKIFVGAVCALLGAVASSLVTVLLPRYMG